MSLREQLFSHQAELNDYIASGFTRIVTSTPDSFESIEPQQNPRFGHESTFLLHRQAGTGAFAQDLILEHKISPVANRDGTSEFVPVTALNMIDRLQIWFNGRRIYEMNDFTVPKLLLDTYVENEHHLNSFKVLVNDTDSQTRKDQTATGVTLHLKLDKICNCFSHPLPTWCLNHPLELRIKYKPLSEVLIGPGSCDFLSSRMIINWIKPNPLVVRHVEGLVRRGEFNWFVHQYLVVPLSNQAQTQIHRHQLNQLVNRDIVQLFFMRRSRDDKHHNPYNFKKIDKWSLRSGSNHLDGFTKDITHETFNGWYLDTLRIIRPTAIQNKNIYFINYSEEPSEAFSQQSGEIHEYHGGFTITQNDATLEIDVGSPLAETEDLFCCAIIPARFGFARGTLAIEGSA